VHVSLRLPTYANQQEAPREFAFIDVDAWTRQLRVKEDMYVAFYLVLSVTVAIY
jgi:hypothetical protein